MSKDRELSLVEAAILRRRSRRAQANFAARREELEAATKAAAQDKALHDTAFEAMRARHRYRYDLPAQLQTDREVAALQRQRELHEQRILTLKSEHLADNALFGRDAFREQLPLRHAAMLERARQGKFEDETSAAAAERDRNRLLPGPASAGAGTATPDLDQLIVNLEARLKAALGTSVDPSLIDYLKDTLAELQAERARISKGLSP